MRVVLGLGSNVGDRLTHLRRALRLLEAELRVLRVSPIYESDALKPEGSPPGWDRPFLNACALCDTDQDPLGVLALAKAIERRLGRKDRERWAPREVDVDLLCEVGDHGSRDFSGEGARLRLPHPQLLERPFALLPLADVAPEWVSAHPEASDRVRSWRSARTSGEVPFRTRRCRLLWTELVGILNLTPDSFSDGGILVRPDGSVPADQVLARAKALIAAGASLLDLGAESTRPGAAPVAPEEEWRRLAPALEVVREAGLPVSVDTRHAEVARRAVRAGAAWINDVSGGESPEMRRLWAESSVEVVVMHHLGVPPRAEAVLDGDPLDQLLRWGERKLQALEGDGIARERVILDPGIGFGKTAHQSLEVLRGIGRMRALGARVLVGHSRKSFLAKALEEASDGPGTWIPAASERDLETAVVSLLLSQRNVDYLRVHDVQASARAMRIGTLVS